LLDQKVTKNQVNRRLLLCAHALPHNQSKPRAAILCATVVRSFPSFSKVC